MGILVSTSVQDPQLRLNVHKTMFIVHGVSTDSNLQSTPGPVASLNEYFTLFMPLVQTAIYELLYTMALLNNCFTLFMP